MIERRSYPRVRASHPVFYYTGPYSRPRVATTVDLSLGGTRIETLYGLISGEGLEISIAIHPQVIICAGIVVHALELPDERPRAGARFLAGVQFEEMSMEDRSYLGEYISHVMGERN